MKITSVKPFILHVPVTGSQIADSTHTISHWDVVGAQIAGRRHPIPPGHGLSAGATTHG